MGTTEERAEEPPSPWPTEVRPLTASVADFESREHCVEAMRGSLPVEVAELFYDLGYDDALTEVCRSLEAAATGDPAHCEALVSGAVRRRCHIRLATLHEKPEVCPGAPGSGPGRDPTCLAWATRDASLCDGAGSAARATCLAVATGERERCEDPLGLRSVASCEALVQRLGGVVNAEAPPERPAPELRLSDESALRLPNDAARSLERGVAASAERCAHRVLVEVRAPVGSDRDTVGLTLELLLQGENATLGPGSEVAFGPVGTGYALRGELTLEEETERRLSGPLVATFEARYVRDGVEHALDGRLRTFFRDLPPLPERCAEE